jgi:hypothetical protein
MVLQLFRGTRRAGPGRLVESVLNMAEEQFQIPSHYRVEIGEEFPEQRANPNTPRWEALVEIPDEVQRTVKAKNLSLQWHAMELARTAIGKLTLINDPQFTPHARLAEKVHFDAVQRTYSAADNGQWGAPILRPASSSPSKRTPATFWQTPQASAGTCLNWKRSGSSFLMPNCVLT